MISWFCLYRFPSSGPASLRQEPHPKATRRLRQSLVHNPPQRVRANPHMRTKPYAKGPCIGVRIYATALETANRIQARRHYQRQGVSKTPLTNQIHRDEKNHLLGQPQPPPSGDPFSTPATLMQDNRFSGFHRPRAGRTSLIRYPGVDCRHNRLAAVSTCVRHDRSAMPDFTRARPLTYTRSTASNRHSTNRLPHIFLVAFHRLREEQTELLELTVLAAVAVGGRAQISVE